MENTLVAVEEQQVENRKHPYHLVDPSPWPLASSMAVLFVMLSAVAAMRDVPFGNMAFGVCMGVLVATMIGWWRDVCKEGDTPKLHNTIVQNGLKVGFALFIASEVMFFFGFFWSYFHAAINPGTDIGGVWPPKGIVPLDPFDLPYFNTLILLMSGTTVTWAHHALLENRMKEVLQALAITVGLGMFFSMVQAYEYMHATFAFKDGIYASTFYMATGFHGFHVIVGTIFLAVCWFRARNGNLSADHHIGFESAAWYWHFVDVVWLFLFIAVYWWGYRVPIAG